MPGWTQKVDEPFRSDALFWRAVGRSVDALVTLIVVTVLAAVFGPVALVGLAVPVALLLVAARHGRLSTARTRAAFENRLSWRDAERAAVATALPGAFTRWPARRREPSA
jgi:hypothetical protein